jgi:hypothetical protein
MSEKEKPFTVSDRRHFTPEGEARERAPEADTGAPRPSPQTSPPRPVEAGGGAVSFGEFLLSLGAQAGMLLNEAPEGQDPATSLEGARQIIAVLEMLEDKTRGRRTDEESRVLDELLFQLRMGYVQRAGRR